MYMYVGIGDRVGIFGRLFGLYMGILRVGKELLRFEFFKIASSVWRYFGCRSWLRVGGCYRYLVGEVRDVV